MPTRQKRLRDDIRRSAANGWSVDACARAYGLTVEEADTIISRRLPWRADLTGRQVEWIKWFASQRLPATHIARVLKLELAPVKNLLREAPRDSHSPKPVKRIKRWHAAARVLNELGHNHTRIALLIGADRGSVIAHLQRVGRLRRKRSHRRQSSPFLTWRRRPERRKRLRRQPWRSYLSKRDRAWIEWFASQKMPSGRIALVLDLDAGMVRCFLGDAPKAPDKPPARACANPKRPVTHWQPECRRLAQLAYTRKQIAHLLGVDRDLVVDYLQRLVAVRCGKRVRPRTRSEQRQFTRNNWRHARAQAQRAERSQRRSWSTPPPEGVDAWRLLDDVGPDGEPLAAPAAVVDDTYDVLDWIGADVPAAMPEEWKGPASPYGTTCRRKLTPSQAIEIRRRHAEGESLKSLARAFHVSRWSIRLIIEDRTYRDCQPSPDPDPSLPLDLI